MKGITEFDYYISPAPESQEFNLHDAEVLFIMSGTGRGMPPIDYITEQGPLQHGGSFIDYRLRPRIITMVTRRRFPCREGYWAGRDDLLDALRPNRQAIGQFNPGVLRKILPDGSMRDIEVLIERGPAFEPRATDRWDERAFTEVLRFVAQDPTFYDPIAQAAEFTLVPTLDNLIFYEAPAHVDRMVFPIWFGGTAISSYLGITYSGNWLAYPTIVVTGPATFFRIRNVTTNEQLELAYTIALGEVVTFTLEYGNKTVTNQAGDNLIGYLSTDSDLATFHLEPDPGAAGGVNEFHVFLTGGTPGVSLVEVAWRVRYVGI